MDEEIGFGFSIRMSADDLTANIQIRSDVPFTNGIMVEALEALADHIRMEASQDTDVYH